jgi:lipoprotein-anchoring transpeptidase ErfK/SrfK
MTPTLPAPTTTTTVPTGDRTEAPANSGSGRRVIYAKRAQRVWQMNDDGSIARTYRVSGRMDQPNPGSYQVWSRSAYTCSIGNSATCMRWMVRFAHGPEGDNIGFHEIPRNNGRPLQSDAQLGTPLSHGCVRQSTADAQAMWAFAGIGTVVVVVA